MAQNSVNGPSSVMIAGLVNSFQARRFRGVESLSPWFKVVAVQHEEDTRWERVEMVVVGICNADGTDYTRYFGFYQVSGLTESQETETIDIDPDDVFPVRAMSTITYVKAE